MTRPRNRAGRRCHPEKRFRRRRNAAEKGARKDPNNYQAWFDLGFALNRLARTDESIAAYRKSVAAKPDVFESNLNLGLMLARANNPEAEQFLRAATTLKPTGHDPRRRSGPRLARARASARK